MFKSNWLKIMSVCEEKPITRFEMFCIIQIAEKKQKHHEFIYFYNVTLEGLHFSVAQILSYLMITPQN